MNKDFLKEMIKTWIEEKGTKSFHWLYRNIENNSILIKILNDNISSELIDAGMPQKIYHFYNDVAAIPSCRYCNSKINFTTFVRPYNEFCDRKCSQCYQSENKKETNIKRRNTMLERYGVESPMQHKEFKDRYSINSMLNHGVDWVSKDPVVKKKIKETWANKENLEEINKKRTNNTRIGIRNSFGDHITTPFMVPEIQERVKNIMLDRYGVEYGFQSKEIIDKGKKTNLERYGYENAMQNDDIQKKHFLSSVSLKEYELPSGKVIKIQGYGDRALDELLFTHHEDDLSIEFDCPKIKYQVDGIDHYYRPDIYIKSSNMIIEVKSLWFFDIDFDKNVCKYQAAIDQGYDMEFWIYDKDELISKI